MLLCIIARSGEIIVFHCILGNVCCSRRDGQTGEDVYQDIFELIPATAAFRKYSLEYFFMFIRHISKIVLLTIIRVSPDIL
jgi:hypothetical protein